MLGALLGGAVAAAAGGLTMLLLRSAVQVRTLPERLLEWLLLYVPLDLFEKGLQQFGFDAKRYALYAATMVLQCDVSRFCSTIIRIIFPFAFFFQFFPFRRPSMKVGHLYTI